jgi:hypothetical protein
LNCDGQGEGGNLFEKTNNRGKKLLLDCFLKSFQLRSSSKQQGIYFFANNAFANAWTSKAAFLGLPKLGPLEVGDTFLH